MDDAPPDDNTPRQKPASQGRRRMLGGALAAAVAAVGATFKKPTDKAEELWLRPPGALDEEAFAETCARCFKCGGACPNDCIDFFGLADGLAYAYTPHIKPRTRGCILCGKCAEVCPTGALKPFGPEKDDWLAQVDMGTAHVNKDMCFSFHGRTCGACYRACPLAGTAIKIGVFETPHVQPDHCVGCGLCEQACLHLPQAIRVIPHRMMKAET